MYSLQGWQSWFQSWVGQIMLLRLHLHCMSWCSDKICCLNMLFFFLTCSFTKWPMSDSHSYTCWKHLKHHACVLVMFGNLRLLWNHALIAKPIAKDIFNVYVTVPESFNKCHSNFWTKKKQEDHNCVLCSCCNYSFLFSKTGKTCDLLNWPLF